MSAPSWNCDLLNARGRQMPPPGGNGRRRRRDEGPSGAAQRPSATGTERCRGPQALHDRIPIMSATPINGWGTTSWSLASGATQIAAPWHLQTCAQADNVHEHKATCKESGARPMGALVSEKPATTEMMRGACRRLPPARQTGGGNRWHRQMTLTSVARSRAWGEQEDNFAV